MHYTLELNERPFNAIKTGTKKIEGRTRTNNEDIDYASIRVGDSITFTNVTTKEQITCEVISIDHYPDVRTMLTEKGTKDVLSSGLNVEGGIKSYNSLKGYEEGIKRYGIYALGVRPISE